MTVKCGFHSIGLGLVAGPVITLTKKPHSNNTSYTKHLKIKADQRPFFLKKLKEMSPENTAGKSFYVNTLPSMSNDNHSDHSDNHSDYHDDCSDCSDDYREMEYEKEVREEYIACHQSLTDRIQRYADQGRLRVECHYNGHVATFYDEHGTSIAMSSGFLPENPYEDELALVRWSEHVSSRMIRIALLMDNLPNGGDFELMAWPFKEQIERSGRPESFIITMRCDCLTE
jgi:hypothetical protein